MEDILKNSVPAIIALLGTLIAVLIGYRQWSRQQKKEGKLKYQTDRKEAYEKLWQLLEQIHVQVRTDSVGKHEFDTLVREVNTFVLKSGLYLEKEDSVLAI